MSGVRPGDRGFRAVRLRLGPGDVPEPGQQGTPERGLPGARVPVGVVLAAARAGQAASEMARDR